MDSSNHTVAWRGVGIAATNVLLAVLFATFAYAHMLSFIAQPRLSVLLIVAVEGLVALMLLVRKDPDKTRHSWQTWLTTFGGSVAPLLLRPTEMSGDLLAGQVLQIFGFGLQIAAVLSLNRSFGLLPAHRGVKSDGLYRWVRHPLYSAYLFAHVGYLVNNPSLFNLTVIVAGLVFQVMRILYEESLLLEYPEYADYAGRTKWRLIPAIW